MFAIIWLAGSVAMFAPQGWEEWQKKEATFASVLEDKEWVLMVPADCSLARGRGGDLKDDADYEQRDGKCWYDFRKFRLLYPEYIDMNDQALASKLYAKAGIIGTKSAKLFAILRQFLIIGVGVPLILLAFGAGLAWVFRGFKTPAAK